MSYIVKWMNENKDTLYTNFIEDCERFLKSTCLISEINRQYSNVENVYIPKSKQLIKELNILNNSMDMGNRKRIREIKIEMLSIDKQIKNTDIFIKKLEELFKNYENFTDNFKNNKITFMINDIEICYNINKENHIFEISDEQLLLLDTI